MYFNEWIGNIIEKKAFFDYKCIACGNSISFNKVNCDVCNASIPNKVRNKYKLRIFSLGIILMSLLLSRSKVNRHTEGPLDHRMLEKSPHFFR